MSHYPCSGDTKLSMIQLWCFLHAINIIVCEREKDIITSTRGQKQSVRQNMIRNIRGFMLSMKQV